MKAIAQIVISVIAILAVAANSIVNAAAPTTAYTFTSIDAPDATLTSASKINSSGKIVGDYYDGIRSHGFLLDDGVFTMIDFPGAYATGARSINDRGQIVGGYANNFGIGDGFLLDRGVFTGIAVPGAVATAIFDINNRGQMVGSYSDSNNKGYGFLLDQGQFTAIDAPDAISTTAHGINKYGQVVGDYVDSKHITHGYLGEDGVFTTIDELSGGAVTAIYDINDKGQIVGFAPGGIGGFLLHDGEFISLNVPDAESTSALGINNRGEIVGEYSTVDSPLHGFLATPGKRHKGGT